MGAVVMEKQVFRQKSIDTISSPEQLNDYIRVSSPGVWATLAGVIVLLAGACVWGVFGRLDTVVPAVAVSEAGCTNCYVAESAGADLEAGMMVRINDTAYTVASVSDFPAAPPQELEETLQYAGQLQPGEWVYTLTLDGSVESGVYRAEVVTERTAPISFLWN